MSEKLRVGIVGSGRIGGNLGQQLARRGHEVLFSFSRDEATLRRVAEDAGDLAAAGTPRDAAEFGDAVILAVPWAAIDEALEQTGPLSGRVVIDTTNQFGAGGLERLDGPAVAHNAERMQGAKLAKAFNTLTAGYQRELTARLIADCNFVPVDIGGWAQVGLIEAPRRAGSVYGEAYRPDAAHAIAAAAREDQERASRLATELRLSDDLPS